MYNHIGLEPKNTTRRYASVIEIRGNGIRWNETKHVELEQFLHAFTSRGFDSVSWTFLLRLRENARFYVNIYTFVFTGYCAILKIFFLNLIYYFSEL